MEDFKNWKSSCKEYSRKDFMAKFPTIKLKGACDDVLLYDGGHHIQVLFDGTFYECNTNRHKILEIVELELYLKKVEQKIYK